MRVIANSEHTISHTGFIRKGVNPDGKKMPVTAGLGYPTGLVVLPTVQHGRANFDRDPRWLIAAASQVAAVDWLPGPGKEVCFEGSRVVCGVGPESPEAICGRRMRGRGLSSVPGTGRSLQIDPTELVCSFAPVVVTAAGGDG